MDRGRRRALLIAGFASAVMLRGLPALAQADAGAGWPWQPVKIVVGFAPGGGNDLFARIISPKLSERLGQPVVIENKPGAGAILAADLVARAAPDGYTLLVATSSTVAINPAVYSKLPYDPQTSYELVSNVVNYPFVLSVSAAGPIKTVTELVEWGKANPDRANYGSTSALFQLPSELFNSKTGAKFEHIPFKSGAEVIAAIITGQVTMAFADAGSLMSQIKGGKVRPIATTGAKRMPDLPDIPTMTEAGVPDLVMEAFSGIAAPRGTPQAIVKRLETELIAVARLPEVRERLAQIGMQPLGETSAEFTARVAREIPMWTAVAKAANIKLD